MKKEITILLVTLLFAGAAQAQTIYYLEKNQKYTHHLTREISAEDEMARIDSLCANMALRLDSFSQTTTNQPNDKRVYYYRGDTLLVLKDYMEDKTTTNRAEWYFQHNKLVCMKHYVRYKDSGKYFDKIRLYYSPLQTHGPFAVIKFDRREAERSADFESD